MAELSRAVFLSYASQDAEPARQICGALRVSGIEVWFDQSELRGGDIWDQKIRREIRDCALFIPIISQHTQERLEGYFRREHAPVSISFEHAWFLLASAISVPKFLTGFYSSGAVLPLEIAVVNGRLVSGIVTHPTADGRSCLSPLLF